jgi:hypothetical protein
MRILRMPHLILCWSLPSLSSFRFISSKSPFSPKACSAQIPSWETKQCDTPTKLCIKYPIALPFCSLWKFWRLTVREGEEKFCCQQCQESRWQL